MRINLTMTAIEAATAIAGLSSRALEIAIESLMRAEQIDPQHFAKALSTVYDLDHYLVYDDKIVELFDRVCCGCHVNLKTRLRARSLALLGEEGFWAPDLCVPHYLERVRKQFPMFAKGMVAITARQKESAPPPPVREDAERSRGILDSTSAVLSVLPASVPGQRDTSDPNIETPSDYTGGFPGE